MYSNGASGQTPVVVGLFKALSQLGAPRLDQTGLGRRYQFREHREVGFAGAPG